MNISIPNTHPNYTKSVNRASFLRSGVNLDLTPTEQTPKIPLHRPFLIPLYRSFAVKLTFNMYTLHLRRACNLPTSIQSFTRILLLISHDWNGNIFTIWTRAHNLHSSMNQKHLHKLSHLCCKAFQTDCTLSSPSTQKYPVFLLANPPLPLPTPTTQPLTNNIQSALMTQCWEPDPRKITQLTPSWIYSSYNLNPSESNILTKGLTFLPLQAL